MQCLRWIAAAGVVAGLVTFLSTPIGAPGQEVQKTTVGKAVVPAVPAVAQADESVKSITDDYDRKLLALERERLERLDRLAGRQNPAEAAATYEQLFRLAIGANLFRDAEPAVLKVLSAGSPAAITRALAHVVKIIAEADRGAYEQSLASLKTAMSASENAQPGQAPKAELLTAEIVGMCDAYYQRLLQARQYEPVRKRSKSSSRAARIQPSRNS